jgi:hypothetical protein
MRALLPRNSFPHDWSFVDGDFHDLVEQSNLLVSNASSVCLEAIAKGLPVVIAASSGIVQNIVPSTVPSTLWALASTGGTLAAAVARFRQATKEQLEARVEDADVVLRSYFLPVTRETVARFLELDSSADQTSVPASLSSSVA